MILFMIVVLVSNDANRDDCDDDIGGGGVGFGNEDLR